MSKKSDHKAALANHLAQAGMQSERLHGRPLNRREIALISEAFAAGAGLASADSSGNHPDLIPISLMEIAALKAEAAVIIRDVDDGAALCGLPSFIRELPQLYSKGLIDPASFLGKKK